MRSLFRSAHTVGGMTLLSRVFGLVRDVVLARYFGAGQGFDVFIVAFRIPNFLRRLFAEGGFSQAFVPVLSEYRETRGEGEVKALIDHTAATLAAALEGHPAVERIDHPSLASHPEHVLAGKLFDTGRYGAVVTVHPKGGREEGMAFVDRLRVAVIAASLGGTHTLVGHVSSTSHRNMTEAELADAGVSPGAVRFSIGLEDPQDLVDDVLVALDGEN